MYQETLKKFLQRITMKEYLASSLLSSFTREILCDCFQKQANESYQLTTINYQSGFVLCLICFTLLTATDSHYFAHSTTSAHLREESSFELQRIPWSSPG